MGPIYIVTADLLQPRYNILRYGRLTSRHLRLFTRHGGRLGRRLRDKWRKDTCKRICSSYTRKKLRALRRYAVAFVVVVGGGGGGSSWLPGRCYCYVVVSRTRKQKQKRTRNEKGHGNRNRNGQEMKLDMDTDTTVSFGSPCSLLNSEGYVLSKQQMVFQSTFD